MPEATAEHTSAETCGCLQCELDRDFEMPPEVQKACLDGELVIFAGAGISTESRMVVQHPLYLQMLLEVGMDPRESPSFPSVMTEYEALNGRGALLERIKEHLDYVQSFPNIDGEAGRFHSALAGVYTIKDIVTTNWDDYFERNCGAQPFVTEDDWAFWKSSKRKVFKLHGSISNPGSIVATEADYKKCYRNLNQGLIGARLKMLLATKTIVFVGYSLQDSDFAALYRPMKRRMGDLLPRAYIVTPFETEIPKFAEGMHLLRTSGLHFVETLKDGFPEDELLPDERFAVLPLIRAEVRKLHHEMVEEGEMRCDPAMFMCACYQDGLMDAFDHQMANAPKGDYFHRCYSEGLARNVYEKLRGERADEGVWHTVAYIEGYINGLLFLIADDKTRESLPRYFIHDDHPDLHDLDEYHEAAKEFARAAPDIFAYAKTQAEKLQPGVVFQHMPSI